MRKIGLSTLAPLVCFLTAPKPAFAQDALGLANGYINHKTKNFDVQLVRDSQTLASLRPSGNQFDFLPFDYLPRRARNGQYHWGDLTLRYREANSDSDRWTDANTVLARKPVRSNAATADTLSAANLAATFSSTLPLNITREWIDVNGDLGLRVTLTNTGRTALEIGSLGFPSEFNSIFTGRSPEQTQQKCSLADPYIGMHAGYIQVVPVRGTGTVLLVTPLGDTPFEAWRNLAESSYQDTGYGSQTFEGFYEWQVLTEAWATKEWASADPWNAPSSRVLQPNQSLTVGLRFSLAPSVRDINHTLRSLGLPVAVSNPGYILAANTPSTLLLHPPANQTLVSVSASPPSSLSITPSSDRSNTYTLTPSSAHHGRARLTVLYSGNHTQTIHYHLTQQSFPSTISALGNFLTTSQLFNVTADPFNRSPSIISYDFSARKPITQDNRVWIAGLSDEAGAGSYLAAVMKQAFLPSEREVSILEEFIHNVLWGGLQNTDFSVKKSLFYYQPSTLAGYAYEKGVDWSGWMSWNRTQASKTDRAYNYVHVAAAYWAMYRVGRGYPALLKKKGWEWYLDQAAGTVLRALKSDVGHSGDGLMGETVFGEILRDLQREGKAEKAREVEGVMRGRARRWDGMAVPFGSEMAWDSTGQEGVWFWSRYFGYTATATKALNTVLGYTPTVPHWGWNGNARRYWDNVYGGKLRRIERQIHHYGSALNALVLLSAFRNDPTDLHLLRVGYGGMMAPLSNINKEGFASASFHSWPDTLQWDAYSGDYGPGFVGLALGSSTYLVDDPEMGGLVAYGGDLRAGGVVTVQTRDAFRRRVFVAPLRLLITIDAGIISEFSYSASNATVALTLAQLEGGPTAASTVVWLEVTAGNSTFTMTTPGLTQARQGWQVPLSSGPVTVAIKKA
ncbi:hypothetical protein B0T16DRAFT_328617 [Cercophora newfieldiana]|uniref:Uncharacterized protein n=1 Tax=Cercophora newfieldiana TaxID=92897 RepID=A0AA39Y9B4_9PEZI|nr:hypothetical protein B0T16DRAFT_328617 [Cercophora newfieldiana]